MDSYLKEALADGARIAPDSIAELSSYICGCGSPENAYEFVLQYLNIVECGHRYEPLSGAEWLAIYILDRQFKLTEHGSSIASSWLTPKGVEVQHFIREHGASWQETGKWVSSEGVWVSYQSLE